MTIRRFSPRCSGISQLCRREEQDIAISTLASRPQYALGLLAEIEKGKIPARDLSVYSVRQLQALDPVDISRKLEQVWGTRRPTAAAKLALLSKYKNQLDEGTLKHRSLAWPGCVCPQLCELSQAVW